VRFELSARGGDQVLVADDLSVGILGRTLVEGFSAVARRQDVIAVVGPNGSGKTTLLATLLGERPPAAGKVRLGAGITPAWFRQDHAHLPDGKTLYQCVADARPAWSRGQIQDHLGRFAFSGDEVRRTTDSLSGGERARAALALITLQGTNLLALDEPTNHLDVESIEALEDALDRYPGTVLLVSHDRALLRELSTRVWAFRDGRLQDYPAPFVDWERKVAEEEEGRVAAALAAERESREAGKLRSRKAAEVKRQAGAPLRAAKKEVEAAERAVHAAEARGAELEAALADPSLYEAAIGEGAREAARLGAELKEAQDTLENAMEGWTRAMEALEEVEG
jgi:ATP-binding cassette subfamily F protein 3